MLDEIPYELLVEWRAFDQIEPFGFIRQDWQSASITAGISNVIAASVRSKQRFKVEDFLLKFRTAEEIQTVIDSVAQAAPAVDWKRMKLIARLCAADANINAARDEERAVKRAKKKAAKEAEALKKKLLGPQTRPVKR